VVFLVDSSNYLGIKSFPFVRTFLNRMISSLPIEANKYRVALAQYSDALHNEFQLGTFKNRNPMLNHLKKNFGFIGGSLKIGNALQEAHRTYFSAPTNGRDKKQFPPILVVLASAESEDDVEEAAKALREDGVKIISVGVQKASEENLKAMATSQFHFNLRTARDLGMFAPNMTRIIKDVTQYREGTTVDLITAVAPTTPAAPATPAAPTIPAALTTAANHVDKTGRKALRRHPIPMGSVSIHSYPWQLPFVLSQDTSCIELLWDFHTPAFSLPLPEPFLSLTSILLPSFASFW
jgi:hypothetical protein